MIFNSRVVTDEAVRELHRKCGLDPEACRAALRRWGGDVDRTLARLIEKGKVTLEQLDPDTVPDHLFGRAQRLEYVRLARQFGRKYGGWILALVFGVVAKRMMAKRKSEVDEAAEGRTSKILQKVRRRSAWLEAHPVTLEAAPFPPLKLGINDWKGKDTLATWAGFQAREGPYTSRSSRKPSTGKVTFEIPRDADDEDDVNPRPPAPEYAAAYAHLKQNEAEVTAAILQAVLGYYDELREAWKGQGETLPKIESPEGLKKHIGLGQLHVLPVAKDGAAYLGFELGCTWDEEHGCGVLVHRSRVVDVGQADTSFDHHAAIEDSVG